MASREMHDLTQSLRSSKDDSHAAVPQGSTSGSQPTGALGFAAEGSMPFRTEERNDCIACYGIRCARGLVFALNAVASGRKRTGTG